MKLILIFSLLIFTSNVFSKSNKDSKTKSITPKEFFKDIKVDSLGGHLGFVSPEDGDATISFGIDVPLGTITKYKIKVKTSLEYWSASSVNGEFSDFMISTYGVYSFKRLPKYKITPYAGAGISMHFYESSINTTVLASNVVVESSSTNLGLDLIAGGIYDWKKNVDLFSEAKYKFVSDAGQLGLVVGAIYKF
jgi:opacity protein-like surface antigen